MTHYEHLTNQIDALTTILRMFSPTNELSKITRRQIAELIIKRGELTIYQAQEVVS